MGPICGIVLLTRTAQQPMGENADNLQDAMSWGMGIMIVGLIQVPVSYLARQWHRSVRLHGEGTYWRVCGGKLS